MPAYYDSNHSSPNQDAVVLRIDRVCRHERLLLHKLNLDNYNSALDATVVTFMLPRSFNAEVRPGA
jgi:hypothetical protein